MTRCPTIALVLATMVWSASAFAQVTPQGSEFVVNAATAGLQIRPDVAHTAGGEFVVVWGSYAEEGSLGIRARRFTAAGAANGGDFAVNGYTTGEQSSPAVDADADGNFVVVWDDEGGLDGEGDGIFARRFTASGTAVGTQFQVNSFTTSDQYDPDVAVASDGSFVVVWESAAAHDGDATGVFAQIFDAGAVPQGTEFQVNAFSFGYQDFPEVDIRESGEFVVVWTGTGQDDQSDDYGAGMFGRRFNADGSGAGTEFQINQYTTGFQQSGDVALQSDGSFLIAWADGEQLSNTGIFARPYGANGAPAGGELVVHSYATAEKFVPRVSTAGGGFVVVWNSSTQDGSEEGVFGQQLDGAGAHVGTEFRVNTATANAEYRPAISEGAGGGIVVVWQHVLSAQDSDIAGQRYGSAGAGGTCGDPVALVARRARARANVITASDALATLRTAVGLNTCVLCVCDVNGSGSVTAGDALVVLRAAVGQSAPLDCPACG